MPILANLLLLLISFFEIVFPQTEPCLGYDSSSNTCLDCGYQSYKTSLGIGTRVNLVDCKPRLSDTYSKLIYISNKKCSTGAPCNGSAAYPYDTIITAFVKEGNLANPYLFSNISFKILGSPHYILRKHLATGREQIFRRLNASIMISPLYCEEANILGCFLNTEKPLIYVKVDTFYLYIAYKMTIKGIIFNGTDMHTHTSVSLNVATGYYNLESIYCTPALINVSYSSTRPCGLYNRRITTKSSIYWWAYFGGMINPEAIIDDPKLIVPEVYITDCIFFHMYGVKLLDGWLAIVYINDNYAAKLAITRTTFKSIRFIMGIMLQEDMELFADNNVYYQNWLNSERFVNIINCVIDSYNAYYMKDTYYFYYQVAIFTFGYYTGVLEVEGSEFKNFRHQATSYSIFIVHYSMGLQITGTTFSSIYFILFTYCIQTNIFIDSCNFTSYTFPEEFIEVTDNFLTVSKTIFREFTSTSSVVGANYEGIFVSNGVLVFTENVVLFSEKFTFRINFGSSMTIQGCTFSYINILETFPLFRLYDCYFTLKDTSLINMTTSEFNIFLIMTDLALNAVAINIEGLYLKNSSIIPGTLPLKALIFWPASNPGDNFNIAGIYVDKVETLILIKSPDLFYLNLKFLTIINQIFDSTIFTIIEASNYISILISVLSVQNSYFQKNCIKLACSDCSSSLHEISFIGTSKLDSSDLVLISGGVIKISELEIKFPLVSSSGGSSLGTFFFVKNIQTVDITNTFVLLSDDFKIQKVFHIESCLKTAIKNLTVITDIKGPVTGYASVVTTLMSKEVYIDLLEAINLRGFYSDAFITQNGFLNLLGSAQRITDKNNFFASLKNIIIKNCSNFLYGAVGLINMHFIEMKNITFINVSSKIDGGSLFINYATNVNISEFFSSNSTSWKGGALYLKSINALRLINSSFTNISSSEKGGTLYISLVDVCWITDFNVSNSSSQENGGILYGEKTTLFMKNLMISNIYCKGEGAIVFLSKGAIEINIANTKKTSAENGGLLSISEAQSAVLTQIVAKDIFVLAKGGALYILDLASLIVKNMLLSQVKGVEDSKGTIYLENTNENVIQLYEGLILEYIDLISASFFYYRSNSKMTFKNLTIKNCKGNLISISSLTRPFFIFENSIFLNNDASSSESMIEAEFCQFIFSGSSLFEKNSALASLFSISYSNFSAEHLKILDESKSKDLTSFIIFQFYSSNTTLVDFIYSTLKSESQIILQEYGYLRLEEIKITGCAAKYLSCFYLTSLSLVSVLTSIFTDNSGGEAGVFYIKNSDYLLMKYSKFSNNIQDGNDFPLVSDLSLSYMKKVDISNSEFIPQIQCASIIITDITIVSIKESIFKAGNKTDYRQALLMKNSNGTISGCSFFELLRDKGPAINFVSRFKTGSPQASLQVIECLFGNNMALVGGAIYILGFVNIELRQNFFYNNKVSKEGIKTGIAGSVFISTEKSQTLTVFLSGNKFINNLAEMFAPTVFSTAKITLDENNPNLFEGNLDGTNFTINISAFPLKLKVTSFDYGSADLNNYNISEEGLDAFIISGLKFSFKITITDYFDQPLSFDSSSRAKIDNKEINIQASIAYSKNGEISFENVIIFATPNKTFNLEISLGFLQTDVLPDTLEINPENELLLKLHALSRKCLVGEIYNTEEPSCKRCSRGKYSIIDPMDKSRIGDMKCFPCEANAECSSGAKITPLKGYWRSDNMSTLIIECVSKDACLGYAEDLTEEETVKGRCAPHHSGNLCYICEEGYARLFFKGLCVPCRSNAQMYIKIVLAMIAIFIYISFQVQYTFKSNKTSYSGILMKLLINHFQQISMISLVDLGWTPDIKDYFSIQQYFSFISEEFISVDCFVQDLNYNLLAQKIIVSNVMPIFLSLIALTIWILTFSLHLAFKRKLENNYLLDRIRVSSLIITYLLFPEILRKCFSLMNCMKIDNSTGQKALTLSPDIICWESSHTYYVVIAALPGLLFWGFFTPFFIWYLLYRYRGQIIKQIKLTKKINVIDRRETKVKTVIEDLRTVLHRFQPAREQAQGTLPTLFGKSIEPLGVNSKRRENFFERKKDQEHTFSEYGRINNFVLTPVKIDNFVVEEESYEDEPIDENTSKQLKGSSSIRKSNTNYSKSREASPRGKKLTIEKLEASLFETNEKMKRQKMGEMLKFLYKGYSPKFYYWELVMFSKKFFLIFIGSFTEFFPSTTKATILLIVLTLYLLFQTKFNPFETQFLNRIEHTSLLVTFVTSNMGIMLFTDELKNLSELFLSVILIVNLGFIILWVRTFRIYVLKKGYCEFIKERLRKRRIVMPKKN